MAQKVQAKSVGSRRATTVEAREDQLIALAIDLVEERLRNKTATSQEICHFLKLGSTKEKLEKQMIAENIELAKAKKDSLQSAQRVEELYTNAIEAFKSYNGSLDESDDQDL